MSRARGAGSDLGRAEAGRDGLVNRREALLGIGDAVVPVARLVGDHRVLVALDRTGPGTRVLVAGQRPRPGRPARTAGAPDDPGGAAWRGARGLRARGVGAHVGGLARVV